MNEATAMNPEVTQLQARIDALESKLSRQDQELNKVYARLASEKLRANQMTMQHGMQSAMHAEASHKVARARATLASLSHAAQCWLDAPKDDSFTAVAERIRLRTNLTTEIYAAEQGGHR